MHALWFSKLILKSISPNLNSLMPLKIHEKWKKRNPPWFLGWWWWFIAHILLFLPLLFSNSRFPLQSLSLSIYCQSRLTRLQSWQSAGYSRRQLQVVAKQSYWVSQAGTAHFWVSMWIRRRLEHLIFTWKEEKKCGCNRGRARVFYGGRSRLLRSGATRCHRLERTHF
jgi:hypothetical protein